MDGFVRAIAADLRALADSFDNSEPTDYLQFRFKRLLEDLAQLSADGDIEVDVVLDGLQEAAHELQIRSVTEEEGATFGRPQYILPPDIIEAHLLLGHTVGDIAQLFGVCERTIHRRMAQYGIR